MNAVLHFELISDEHGLIDFLDYQKLLTNIDELDGKTEQLTLMTLHAAKGDRISGGYHHWYGGGEFPDVATEYHGSRA